jgi:hypothetical protein
MTVNKLVVLLLATFGIMTSAFAAGKSRELAIDGNYISVQGQSSASLLNISLGQFLTPQFAIVTNLTAQENFVYNATSIGLGGKYYFMMALKVTWCRLPALVLHCANPARLMCQIIPQRNMMPVLDWLTSWLKAPPWTLSLDC